MLAALAPDDRGRLTGAMAAIERLLGEARGAAPRAILREPRPGDMGFVVQSHGALYASEYGFDAAFEALVADIAAKFLTSFDASRERCWIADVEDAGSRYGPRVFCWPREKSIPTTASCRWRASRIAALART